MAETDGNEAWYDGDGNACLLDEDENVQIIDPAFLLADELG